MCRCGDPNDVTKTHSDVLCLSVGWWERTGTAQSTLGDTEPVSHEDAVALYDWIDENVPLYPPRDWF